MLNLVHASLTLKMRRGSVLDSKALYLCRLAVRAALRGGFNPKFSIFFASESSVEK
jgi:hypothetical protein